MVEQGAPVAQNNWAAALKGKPESNRFAPTQLKIFFIIFTVIFGTMCWLYFLYMISRSDKPDAPKQVEHPIGVDNTSAATQTSENQHVGTDASPQSKFGTPRTDVPYSNGGSLSSIPEQSSPVMPADAAYGSPAAPTQQYGAATAQPYAGGMPQYQGPSPQAQWIQVPQSGTGLHDLTLPRNYRHASLYGSNGAPGSAPRYKLVVGK